MKLKDNLAKILIPILSILIAFIAGGIIILCLGKNPVEAYGYLFSGAFGSGRKMGQTLVIACPLIFTGLAAAFAYKCGVFNLGGEGQFIMGAVTSIFVSAKLGDAGMGGLLVSLLAGTVAGGIWGAIPGILKITRGLNEMIVSIMLNYVATLFMGYVYTTLLRDGSTDGCSGRQYEDCRYFKRISSPLGCSGGVFACSGFILFHFLYVQRI